jgi:hypothetical protein
MTTRRFSRINSFKELLNITFYKVFYIFFFFKKKILWCDINRKIKFFTSFLCLKLIKFLLLYFFFFKKKKKAKKQKASLKKHSEVRGV